MLPQTLFVPSINHHGACFRPGEVIKYHHRRSAAIENMNSGSSPGVLGAYQGTTLLKKALLVSKSGDVSSIARGENLAGTLASQGFRVSSLSGGAAPRIIEGLSDAEAKSTVPFDLSGWAGRELTEACEAAGVAALYSYKPATGMFKKVRGMGEIETATGYIRLHKSFHP